MLAILAGLILGCSEPKPEELVIGAWQVEDMSIDMTYISGTDSVFAMNEARSRQYTFYRDNSFLLVSNFVPGGLQGYWAYNPENQVLTLRQDAEDFLENHVVTVITESNMSWYQIVDLRGSITMKLTRIPLEE